MPPLLLAGCSFLDAAALHLVSAVDMAVENVTVAHTGGIGVWVEGGSQGVTMERLNMYDLGAGGLRVGRGAPLADERLPTSNITVNNSKIVNGSKVSHRESRDLGIDRERDCEIEQKFFPRISF